MVDTTTLATLKSTLVVAFIITVALILSMLMSSSRDDFTHEVFVSLNQNTHYTLEGDGKSSSGQLGHFYDCLKEKKNIAHLKPKGKKTERYKLIISPDVYLRVTAAKGEAYRFTIISGKSMIPGRTYSSPSYAINCELSLLDKS